MPCAMPITCANWSALRYRMVNDGIDTSYNKEKTNRRHPMKENENPANAGV